MSNDMADIERIEYESETTSLFTEHHRTKDDQSRLQISNDESDDKR